MINYCRCSIVPAWKPFEVAVGARLEVVIDFTENQDASFRRLLANYAIIASRCLRIVRRGLERVKRGVV